MALASSSGEMPRHCGHTMQWLDENASEEPTIIVNNNTNTISSTITTTNTNTNTINNINNSDSLY